MRIPEARQVQDLVLGRLRAPLTTPTLRPVGECVHAWRRRSRVCDDRHNDSISRAGAVVRRIGELYQREAGTLLPVAAALFAVQFLVAIILPTR